MTGSTSKSRGVDLNFDPIRAYMTEVGGFFALQLKFSFFYFFISLNNDKTKYCDYVFCNGISG